MKKNENNPLISIVVPVYNVSKYLDRCIFSLLNQTYSNIEILLVDDGSTDDSGVKCDFVSKKDGRVTVIHQTNKGLSGARNSGIKIAKGDYITFVDSDDWIEPSFCSDLLGIIQKDESDISICTYYIANESGETKYVNQLFEKDCCIRSCDLYPYIFTWRGISAWGKLYKKQLFDIFEYPEGKIDEDFAIIYKLLFNTKKVSFTKKPLYYYFSRTGSIVNSPFNISKCDFADNAYDALCYVKNQTSDKRIIKLARSFYFRRVDFVVRLIQKSDNRKDFYKIQKKYRLSLFKNIFRIIFSRNIELKPKTVMVLDMICPNIYYRYKRKNYE